MLRSDSPNPIAAMTLPFDIHQRLEELRRDFAEQSRVKVDEMTDLLAGEEDARATELPKYIRVTLHEMKGQAGTFGYPLITDIARVAEKYAANATHFDDTTIRHLNALLDMMRNLLVEPPEEFEETASNGSRKRLPVDSETSPRL